MSKSNYISKIIDPLTESEIKDEIIKRFKSRKQKIFAKVVTAALGSVPWVGGFITTVAAYRDEKENNSKNELYVQWIEEHARKMALLAETLASVLERGHRCHIQASRGNALSDMETNPQPNSERIFG
jgi:hypothetical protein